MRSLCSQLLLTKMILKEVQLIMVCNAVIFILCNKIDILNSYKKNYYIKLFFFIMSTIHVKHVSNIHTVLLGQTNCIHSIGFFKLLSTSHVI